jgi:hypothetical protein
MYVCICMFVCLSVSVCDTNIPPSRCHRQSNSKGRSPPTVAEGFARVFASNASPASVGEYARLFLGESGAHS